MQKLSRQRAKGGDRETEAMKDGDAERNIRRETQGEMKETKRKDEESGKEIERSRERE